jgi:ParB/RepB/Spo0J family partition protein
MTELDLALSACGERYGALRLINPKAERHMKQSIERYGQMSPVVVCRLGAEGYELIDGFKRLRASRQLGGQRPLRARVMEVGARVAKASMLCLNWIGNSTSELEEGWVVRSLYREDQLTQDEIGTLLGHDKSWVSRRLALVEKLSEEVQHQIRLGLVSATVGRELARLPRGNQDRLLEVVNAQRLCSRETADLVNLLLQAPREHQERILLDPRKALLEHGKGLRGPPRDERLSVAGNRILRGLHGMEQACVTASKAMCSRDLDSLTQIDRTVLLEQMARTTQAGSLAFSMLDSATKVLRMLEERPNGAQ